VSKQNKLEFKKYTEIMVISNGDRIHSGTIARDDDGHLKLRPPHYVQFTMEELKLILKTMEESGL